jgi:hypothetical protein
LVKFKIGRVCSDGQGFLIAEPGQEYAEKPGCMEQITISRKRSGNMTDKEFKRLSRSQLIEIIYQLQLKQEELTAENDKLSKALEDKRILVSEAGNLAEAALAIHHVMQTAQDAAAHYLEEIRLRCDETYQQTLKKANEEAAGILAKARREAGEMVLKARHTNSDEELAAEALFEEWRQG